MGKNMKKLIVSVMTMAFVLTGCGSSATPLEELYSDMDAEETYDAMMEYMEEEVRYFGVERENRRTYEAHAAEGNAEYVIEKDGSFQMISRNYNKDEEIETYTIMDGKDAYQLLYNAASEEYTYYTGALETSGGEEMYDILGLKDEDYTILDGDRKEEDDGITLTFEVSWELGTYAFYYTYEYSIDEEGYLSSCRRISYTDETFTEMQDTTTYVIVDINDKTSIDTKSAITEIEAYAKELVP